MQYLDYVTKKFEAKNWRCTKGVRNVVQLFEEVNNFLSVAEIQKKLSDLDLATVYRILKRLSDIDLVHEHQGQWILCANPANTDDHHFLICDKCGNAEEIFLDYRDSIGQQLTQEKGFALKEVDLSFRGHCLECS